MFPLNIVHHYFFPLRFVYNFNTNLNPYSPDFRPQSNLEVENIEQQSVIQQESAKMPGENEESKDFLANFTNSFYSIFANKFSASSETIEIEKLKNPALKNMAKLITELDKAEEDNDQPKFKKLKGKIAAIGNTVSIQGNKHFINFHVVFIWLLVAKSSRLFCLYG
jgi:hypothetical protein